MLWISFELIIVYYYHLNLFSSTTGLWLWLLPTATTNTYPQILYNSIFWRLAAWLGTLGPLGRVLLKQHTSLTPLPLLTGFGEGRIHGDHLPPSQWIPAPQFPPLLNLHNALNGAHLLGSRLPREGIALCTVFWLWDRALCQWEKSQANGRNLHFEHVCFCVVEPEIPYLLMESLIFWGEGLCCYVLWGWESRLFWHGILPTRGTLKARLRVKKAQPASEIIVLQWPLKKAGPQH